MALPTLIINADDFGISSDVNRAIFSSMEGQLVTSTSMMANMPGFKEAVGLVRMHPWLNGRIGIHLNLTEGRPLSAAILGCRRFCSREGSFIYNRRPIFLLSDKERRAVYEEFKAQLERILAAGIRPIHIDSHHHVHTVWALAPLARRLAHDYGIPRIRLTRNIGDQPNFSRRLYKAVFNRWRMSGFRNTDFFGDIADMLHYSSRARTAGKTVEIMVHPLFDEGGRLIDLDSQPLRMRLKDLLS